MVLSTKVEMMHVVVNGLKEPSSSLAPDHELHYSVTVWGLLFVGA